MTLLVLGFAPPCQALDIVFRSTATVSGPSVTLADIADFNTGSEQPEAANALSGQTVAASPDAGEKIVLDTHGIIHKLNQSETGTDNIQWGGAQTVTVSRQGVTITPKIVQKIIDGFLAEHSKELSGISCSFTPTDPPPAFIVPAGDLRWEVTPSNPSIIGSSRFSLIGRIDNQVIKNFSVRGTLKALAPVVVATSNLRRDDLITESQIRLESMDISTLRAPCLQKDQVIGKKVLRAIKAGTAIELANVEFPPLVKKGALVKILGRNNGLELTATGIAKTDGKEGEIIKVKNVNSEKEIFCRVTAPGLVEVQI
jgi:flagella basal body P-ring formation protein FlgA